MAPTGELNRERATVRLYVAHFLSTPDALQAVNSRFRVFGTGFVPHSRLILCKACLSIVRRSRFEIRTPDLIDVSVDVDVDEFRDLRTDQIDQAKLNILLCRRTRTTAGRIEPFAATVAAYLCRTLGPWYS